MTPETRTESPADPFVELSVTTWSGLNDAVDRLDVIADGGDPAATLAERDLANLRRIQLDRERTRVMQRLTGFLAKQLVVSPPSDFDLARARAMATELARMKAANETAVAVVRAATDLLNVYNSRT